MARREDFKSRPIAERDLDLVLNWRNSDRVRTKMFEQSLITYENHLNWFKSLQGSKTAFCWILEYNGVIVGVYNVKRVDEAEEKWIWGCYLSDQRVVPKAGTIMGFMALKQFFDMMNFNLVIGEAVESNVHSLEFNARLGFATARNFTQTTSKGETVPAVYLTMYRNEWRKHKKRLISECFTEQ